MIEESKNTSPEAGPIGTTPAGAQALPEIDKPPLDDSGDDKSRLWRITWWALAWNGVALPAAVAFDKLTGPQALTFIQWMLPILLVIFGGIKAGQKVAGAAISKKK